MVREKKKHSGRKFFLTIKTRFGPSFYRESGVFDVGTPQEEPFLYWTKYWDEAHGFPTVKSARAMARKLFETHAIRVKIVNRDGAIVE